MMRLNAFQSLLPDAAERLGRRFPWDEPHGCPEEDPAKSWAKKLRRRNGRRAARRHLDDADVVMVLMVIIYEGPITLRYLITVLFPETDPGTGQSREGEKKEMGIERVEAMKQRLAKLQLDLDQPCEDEKKKMKLAKVDALKEEIAELQLKYDAARKQVHDTILPPLKDDWGFVIEWKVDDPKTTHGVQNGTRLNGQKEEARPLRKGQSVLEATDSARALFQSIRGTIKEYAIDLIDSIPAEDAPGRAPTPRGEGET